MTHQHLIHSDEYLKLSRICDLNNRSKCVVLDPDAFILSSNFSSKKVWLNFQGKNLFYRKCSDPTAFILREPIKNWDEITYCDYKLIHESLKSDEQLIVLKYLLISSDNPFILHISVDSSDALLIELLDTLKYLPLNNRRAIGIQIIDHTERTTDITDVVTLTKVLFNPSILKNLVCLDYYKESYTNSFQKYYVNLLDGDLTIQHY